MGRLGVSFGSHFDPSASLGIPWGVLGFHLVVASWVLLFYQMSPSGALGCHLGRLGPFRVIQGLSRDYLRRLGLSFGAPWGPLGYRKAI